MTNNSVYLHFLESDDVDKRPAVVLLLMLAISRAFLLRAGLARLRHDLYGYAKVLDPLANERDLAPFSTLMIEIMLCHGNQ